MLLDTIRMFLQLDIQICCTFAPPITQRSIQIYLYNEKSRVSIACFCPLLLWTSILISSIRSLTPAATHTVLPTESPASWYIDYSVWRRRQSIKLTKVTHNTTHPHPFVAPRCRIRWSVNKCTCCVSEHANLCEMLVWIGAMEPTDDDQRGIVYRPHIFFCTIVRRGGVLSVGQTLHIVSGTKQQLISSCGWVEVCCGRRYVRNSFRLRWFDYQEWFVVICLCTTVEDGYDSFRKTLYF